MPIPADYDYSPDGGLPAHIPYDPISWPRTFATWTGANGDIIPLTGDVACSHGPAGIGITAGPTGLTMPTYELKADQLPNLDGGMFRSIRATTRDVTIPIVIRGVDRTSLIKMHNRLLRALEPHRGPGWLTMYEGDGIARHLECYYVSGGEGSETAENSMFTQLKYPLMFRAMDPYWYSNGERQYDWHLDQAAALPFLSNADYPAFFPLRMSSTVFSPDGTVTVVNDSSIEAWPTWSCIGSATGLQMENLTTGQAFRMRDDFTIPALQTMTVDTATGVKTVTMDGANLWPQMRADSSLWSLKPGPNVIRVTAGGTNLNTLIRLHFVPRYLSYVGG